MRCLWTRAALGRRIAPERSQRLLQPAPAIDNEALWLAQAALTRTIRFVMLSIAGAAAGPTNKRWRSSMLADELITAAQSHLFPLPSVFLTGPALATGIAWVNSVGILGGSVSPPIVGWLKDYSGNFTGGLYALAGFGVLAAIVAAVGVRETPAPKRVLEALAAGAG